MKKINLFFDGSETSYLIDLQAQDILNYEDDQEHIHQVFGGQVDYISNSGLTSWGWIPFHPAIIQVGMYRVDQAITQVSNKGQSLTSNFRCYLLVPFKNHTSLENLIYKYKPYLVWHSSSEDTRDIFICPIPNKNFLFQAIKIAAQVDLDTSLIQEEMPSKLYDELIDKMMTSGGAQPHSYKFKIYNNNLKYIEFKFHTTARYDTRIDYVQVIDIIFNKFYRYRGIKQVLDIEGLSDILKIYKHPVENKYFRRYKGCYVKQVWDDDPTETIVNNKIEGIQEYYIERGQDSFLITRKLGQEKIQVNYIFKGYTASKELDSNKWYARLDYHYPQVYYVLNKDEILKEMIQDTIEMEELY